MRQDLEELRLTCNRLSGIPHTFAALKKLTIFQVRYKRCIKRVCKYGYNACISWSRCTRIRARTQSSPRPDAMCFLCVHADGRKHVLRRTPASIPQDLGGDTEISPPQSRIVPARTGVSFPVTTTDNRYQSPFCLFDPCWRIFTYKRLCALLRLFLFGVQMEQTLTAPLRRGKAK